MTGFKISRLNESNHSNANFYTQVDGILLAQRDNYPGNVKFYGAKGDNVSDDTGAINEAITSSNSIYFPPGDYRVSSTIIVPDQKTLWGDKGTVSISPMANISPNPLVKIIGIESRLIGLNLQGTSGVDSITVQIDGVACKFLDCEIYTFTEMGLYLNSSQCIIQDCWIKSNTIDILFGQNSSANVIRNCRKTGVSNFIKFNGGENNIIEGKNGTIEFTNGCLNNVVIGDLNIISDPASTYTQLKGEGIFKNTVKILGAQGSAIPNLNQTISGTYNQSQVQEISDKVDTLLEALREGTGHGLFAA